MSEWKEYKLIDIITVLGGGTPKTTVLEYWNGDIPWLSVADFNNGQKYVYQTEKHITKAGLENSSTRLLNEGDIIISARGTVGITAMLGKPMAFNQSCYGVQAQKAKTFNDYLYYLLRTTVSGFKQIAHGGVFDTITRDTFKDIDILLPTLEEQRSIASILSSLDDKIDLLHRQNATLEKIAETLFRQWFVEEAKEEWEQGKLRDVLTSIESGTRPKGGINIELKAGIPSIGAENINGIGVYDFSKTKYITYDFYRSMRRGVLKDYDVLVYKDGAYIGRKGMFGKGFPYGTSTVNEHVFILRSNERVNQFFLYFLLQQEDLELLNANSAQPGLNQEAMKSLEIRIPPVGIIDKFGIIVRPFVDKILFNSTQIRTLERLRDTLLPKLMSGEVRVTD
ncbi:MAG TPA: restriction endonuclease subunit S [Bacteroidales bacterium]|nr:restriction endonuclease subunit S [Bacteroidales bacterium]